MSAFRTIHGRKGFEARQLGRFGEVTGGWRIYWGDNPVCDCNAEVDARIMLHMFADAHDGAWLWARRQALNEMSKEAA